MGKYTDACLVLKILNGLARPPLSIFVKQKTQTYGSRSTRSAMRGDCIVPLRKSTFSKSAFSVRASHVWNTLPSDTHNCTTYHTFTKCLKTWLKVNQICEHGPCCVLPLSMLSVACEVWKHFVAFMSFVLLLFLLCCSVCMLRLACPILLCMYAMSCLSYGAIVYIVIVFNNLPRDCG